MANLKEGRAGRVIAYSNKSDKAWSSLFILDAWSGQNDRQ